MCDVEGVIVIGEDMTMELFGNITLEGDVWVLDECSA